MSHIGASALGEVLDRTFLLNSVRIGMCFEIAFEKPAPSRKTSVIVVTSLAVLPGILAWLPSLGQRLERCSFLLPPASCLPVPLSRFVGDDVVVGQKFLLESRKGAGQDRFPDLPHQIQHEVQVMQGGQSYA